MGENSPTSGAIVERRRLPRLNLTVPIQFRNVLKNRDPFVSAHSLDLSASGIRMRISSFLPKEARLVLLMSLPGLLRPLRAIGRVVWMQKKSASEEQECGLQFAEISNKDLEIVADYVERGVVVT